MRCILWPVSRNLFKTRPMRLVLRHGNLERQLRGGRLSTRVLKMYWRKGLERISTAERRFKSASVAVWAITHHHHFYLHSVSAPHVGHDAFKRFDTRRQRQVVSPLSYYTRVGHMQGAGSRSLEGKPKRPPATTAINVAPETDSAAQGRASYRLGHPKIRFQHSLAATRRSITSRAEAGETIAPFGSRPISRAIWAGQIPVQKSSTGPDNTNPMTPVGNWRLDSDEGRDARTPLVVFPWKPLHQQRLRTLLQTAQRVGAESDKTGNPVASRSRLRLTYVPGFPAMADPKTVLRRFPKSKHPSAQMIWRRPETVERPQSIDREIDTPPIGDLAETGLAISQAANISRRQLRPTRVSDEISLDRTLVERVTEKVIGRIEQRMRIERERRGL